jgi:hypothetical protein
MAGRSRQKDGVASLAYVPTISLSNALCPLNRAARRQAGHDGYSFAKCGITSLLNRSSERSASASDMVPSMR